MLSGGCNCAYVGVSRQARRNRGLRFVLLTGLIGRHCGLVFIGGGRVAAVTNGIVIYSNGAMILDLACVYGEIFSRQARRKHGLRFALLTSLIIRHGGLLFIIEFGHVAAANIGIVIYSAGAVRSITWIIDVLARELNDTSYT